MACFKPLQAYQTASGSVVFQELSRHGDFVRSLSLACGQCVGCRLERSRQWAVRCVHESQLHERNAFVTLTYAPASLPPGGSLLYRDFQLFMKRLRKHARRPVRFFCCGEYGPMLARPHFHACLFGFDFDDKVFFKKGGLNSDIHTSETLARLWPSGFATVGAVCFESAAYAARYIVDKITGDLAPAHYGGLTPEFVHMSLKPGIGAGWYKRFKSDVFPHGMVVSRGFEAQSPKYYDRLYKRESELDFMELGAQRELAAVPSAVDRSFSRLRVREAVAKAKLATLKRGSI